MADLQLSHQSVQDSPKIVCIALSGEYDLASAPKAEKYFDELMQSESPQHVLLDLSQLSFAGSDFFSSLLFWKEKVAENGGQLALFGLQSQVSSTLRLFVLDRVVTVCPDRETALQKVSAA